jgi:Cu/Ag efflux pump CusA
MKLTHFFIDRPIFAGVLSMLILIAGLVSLPVLPISEYPEVAPPTIVVTAQYPGANPQVIADTVAAPLEQEITGVEDMIYMKSMAQQDGTLQINVVFRLGTDIDRAQVQVQNAMAVCTCATTPCCTCATCLPACRGRATCSCSALAITQCGCGSIRRSSPRATSRPGT